jgi:PII-like signaling protein
LRDALKLAIYFGERDRTEEGFLGEALLGIFERHAVTAGILMRGVEGFGMKHRLRSDRLLTLSEDLPMVAVALGRPEAIERAQREVEEVGFDGLITLERARLLGSGSEPFPPSLELGRTAKLTLYLGRGERLDGRPAHEAVVGLLHELEMQGASVLLGVDGMLHGARRKARFFARNRLIPATVISVGETERLLDAATRLRELVGTAPMTLERVQVLKRDGRRLAGLPRVGDQDETGRARWLKLTLYSSELNHAAGRPAHQEAIRRLRRAGAAGATALRGVWGYHGDHAPHGDALLSLRRRVPTLTVVVDEPERAQGWSEVLDAVSPERGLVTSEVVPALQARSPRGTHGGLRLAERWLERS